MVSWYSIVMGESYRTGATIAGRYTDRIAVQRERADDRLGTRHSDLARNVLPDHRRARLASVLLITTLSAAPPRSLIGACASDGVANSYG
jgi:hypothetical protein